MPVLQCIMLARQSLNDHIYTMKNPNAVSLGLLGASKGGTARALALPEARRRAIGREAAAARWDGRLPEILRPLFWQYVFEDLQLPDALNEVMIHVLTYGGPSHLNWLRRRFGDKEISQWIRKRKGRGLTRTQMAPWVASRTTNRWLAADSVAQIWENR